METVLLIRNTEGLKMTGLAIPMGLLNFNIMPSYTP
jgi:hypothetical protein